MPFPRTAAGASHHADMRATQPQVQFWAAQQRRVLWPCAGATWWWWSGQAWPALHMPGLATWLMWSSPHPLMVLPAAATCTSARQAGSVRLHWHAHALAGMESKVHAGSLSGALRPASSRDWQLRAPAGMGGNVHRRWAGRQNEAALACSCTGRHGNQGAHRVPVWRSSTSIGHAQKVPRRGWSLAAPSAAAPGLQGPWFSIHPGSAAHWTRPEGEAGPLERPQRRRVACRVQHVSVGPTCGQRLWSVAPKRRQ